MTKNIQKLVKYPKFRKILQKVHIRSKISKIPFKENYKFMETLFTELRQVFQDEYIHLGKLCKMNRPKMSRK